jgi:hypothetical protein
MAWRTAAGGTIAGSLTAGQTFNNYDAFSRYDALRYDSPALGPATLSASIGNADRWEVAVRLNTGLAGGQLAAAMFYGQDHGRTATDDDRYGGSASYLFSQGTNLSLAYARNEQNVAGGTDSGVYTVKLGHTWGAHALAAQYSVGDDVTPGYQDTAYGIGYNHRLAKVKADLYAAFLHVELDTPAGIASVEDHNVVIAAARVSFD